MSPDIAPKKEENYILQYVEAAVSASSRARTVTVVLITSAVLVFIAIWNAGRLWNGGEGWMDSRIRLRVDALKFFDPKFSYQNDSTLNEEQKDRYTMAQQFFESREFDRNKSADQKTLDDEIVFLRKIQSEHIRLIRTPFFGVVFDSNDLGLFAGITFFFVLLWLRFSLARELRNLRLALSRAKEKGAHQLRLCYDLLAMHQILNQPPMFGQKWRWVVSFFAGLLYVIPALIYAFAYRSDRQTRNIGYMVNRDNTSFQMKAGAVLLFFIIILTALCLIYYYKIENQWTQAHRDLQQSNPLPVASVSATKEAALE